MLTKGFLVEIIPVVPSTVKQLSGSPPGATEQIKRYVKKKQGWFHGWEYVFENSNTSKDKAFLPGSLHCYRFVILLVIRSFITTTVSCSSVSLRWSIVNTVTFFQNQQEITQWNWNSGRYHDLLWNQNNFRVTQTTALDQVVFTLLTYDKSTPISVNFSILPNRTNWLQRSFSLDTVHYYQRFRFMITIQKFSYGPERLCLRNWDTSILKPLTTAPLLLSVVTSYLCWMD